MKKVLSLVLGVVTSVGGFVEVGSISTAAQAGAEFGFALLWAIALATLILAMMAEMSGRLAAVGRHTVAAAVRERFGFHFHLVPLVAELIVDLLLLAAEIGGVAVALKLATGVGFQWWILPAGFIIWLVIWLGNFDVVEDGVGLLGLITLAFVLSAWRLQPSAENLVQGLTPTLPDDNLLRYSFLAISIVGATVSPYLLNFFSSGAIEEEWSEKDLWINRTTAFGGISFGGIVAMGVLITAAVVLQPLQIQVESYEQASLMFLPVFGGWAVILFAAALGIGCFGAAVELTLNSGYVLAQAFGWPWGINKKRREAPRFSLALTVFLVLAIAIALMGFDPLKVTMVSVALTVVVTPFVVLPFLVLMNNETFVKSHTSGPIGNVLLATLTIVAAICALIVIPLEILGG